MKNIHLLPTDKPSRLQKTKHNNFFLANRTGYEYTDCTAQHIYITSDEEIKEGDWCYDDFLKSVFQANSIIGVKTQKTSKKIILTTDQDLIKDGVQAIPDEFLEWFVKNPSCEEVEVIVLNSINVLVNDYKPYYKIIIPKEEPKQELLPDFKITKNIFDFVTDLSDTKKEEPVSFESFDKEKSEAITTMGQKLVRELQSSMEQETLDEAAERLYPTTIDSFTDGGFDLSERERLIFINGAEWQQERMYSEEIELINWLQSLTAKKFYSSDAEDLLEQFKKK